MIRLRVVQYVIQPVVMEDDGDNLTPLDAQPVTVSASEMSGFADAFAVDLRAEEARRNGSQDDLVDGTG